MVLVLVAGMFLAGAGTAQAADKVLVFSKTAGFRHDSIAQGIALVDSIGAANGLTVDKTEDASDFTAANLAQYKAVIWLSTTGDVLNDAQQAAFEGYIRAAAATSACTPRPTPSTTGRGTAAGRRVVQEPSGDPAGDGRRHRPRASVDQGRPGDLDAHGRVVRLQAQPARRRARARRAAGGDLQRRDDGRRPPDRVVSRVRRRAHLVHGARATRRRATPSRRSART